jgi:hypothetical protein
MRVKVRVYGIVCGFWKGNEVNLRVETFSARLCGFIDTGRD